MCLFQWSHDSWGSWWEDQRNKMQWSSSVFRERHVWNDCSRLVWSTRQDSRRLWKVQNMVACWREYFAILNLASLLRHRSRQRERLYASVLSIWFVRLSVCRQNAYTKTWFSQKLSNLELWCLLTDIRHLENHQIAMSRPNNNPISMIFGTQRQIWHLMTLTVMCQIWKF